MIVLPFMFPVLQDNSKQTMADGVSGHLRSWYYISNSYNGAKEIQF